MMFHRRVSSLQKLALSVFAVVAIACGGSGDGPTTPPPSTGEMSTLARGYLEQIIGIMQANSIKRLTIDWVSFRSQLLAAVPRAQTITDIEPAIELGLRLIGDGHSSYRSAAGRFIFVPVRTCRASGALRPTLPPTIGYVKVGAFSGTAEQALAFANTIQSTIRAADSDSLIGWIVDLRGNGGGNMWPMIAGLGPILGEGVLGFFIDPDGAEVVWSYNSGASWSGQFAAQRVDNPYRLIKENPKVAVLTDNGVASSGEATTIAFRKRANTRSFGVATCGLSTANRGFPLADGALLNLTVSTMADRAKTSYGDVINPDEVIVDQAQADQRAIAWLRSGT